MAIVKMQRVCVIGLDNEKEEFMSRLMDFGVVELTERQAVGQNLGGERHRR